MFHTSFRPEKDIPVNTTHNYYVSKICICSEHCVGFLKGWWSSLSGLRVSINTEDQIKYAALWVITCIHLHMFAVQHEVGLNLSSDDFYQNGIQIMTEEGQMFADWNHEWEAAIGRQEDEREEGRDIELLEVRLKREELKRSLFLFLYGLEN
jgi:hypothetical protein